MGARPIILRLLTGTSKIPAILLALSLTLGVSCAATRDAPGLYERALKEGNDLVAIEDLKLAIAIKPRFGKAWSLLAWHLYLNERYGEADLALSKARPLLPQDDFVLWLSGVVRHALSDDTAAKELLKRSLERSNRSDARIRNDVSRYLLGRIFGKEGDLFVAGYHLTKAAEARPNNWEYHFELGLVRHYRSRYDEAAESFRRALDLNPGDPGILHALAVTSTALETFKARYDERWGQKTEPEAFDDEIALTKRAIEAAPHNAANHWILGILYQYRGDDEAALAAERRSLEIVPRRAGPHLVMAETLFRMGTPEAEAEGVGHLIKGIAADPEFTTRPDREPELIGLLFAYLIKKGRLAEGEALFRWATKRGYLNE